MLRGDAFAVAEPRADDVSGERFRQFGLPARSEVVPQSRPRGHARSLDDLLESSPQVDSLPIANGCGLTMQTGENPSVRISGLLESVGDGVEEFVQVRAQLAEDRNGSRCLAGVMLGLRRMNGQPAFLPIDITPAEQTCLEWLARDRQGAVDDEPAGAVIKPLPDNLFYPANNQSWTTSTTARKRSSLTVSR